MEEGHQCDDGWIHYQHPCKPAGVIMNSEPCPVCNPTGKEKPHPSEGITWYVTSPSTKSEEPGG
jgi:hypothetical protein